MTNTEKAVLARVRVALDNEAVALEDRLTTHLPGEAEFMGLVIDLQESFAAAPSDTTIAGVATVGELVAAIAASAKAPAGV